MLKKFIGVNFLIFVGYTATSHATKFNPLDLPQQVGLANLIVVGKIMNVQCLDEKGVVVPPGNKCTGPGRKNKLHYHIMTTEKLFYRPHAARAKTSRPPSNIKFAFSAKSHWSVPGDQYKSLKGQEKIFMLREDSDGALGPIHEAFFIEPVTVKKEVQELLKNKT